MSTRQKTITSRDLNSREYLRAPDTAKPTALGLWIHTDPHGRRELIPELIAADIYPGRAATDLVVEHLLMLDEAGFLTIYQADGSEWISLNRPLRVDMRSVPPSLCPDPPHDKSRHVAAVGGAGASEQARERASAWVREEAAERASEWAAWEEAQERVPRRPSRPLLMDAPPLGCPEHPHGRFLDCGPCGTARRRHDRWLAERRYDEQMEQYAAAMGDEPDSEQDR